MCYAKTAADSINLMAVAIFPEEIKDGRPRFGVRMASTMANGETIDAFDHQGGGSHKYIPADRLTEELGEEQGSGVFSFWHMKDDSYLLRTCHGALAYWSGKPEDKAQWGMGK